ncbi:acetoacetate--CoA ligase [Marinihelvus fidelis]|uniref:Acetoacetate--CoA ligase n=2 Tax=Marinihelvus fidelis TaxID=2613842 RepID=A0A5N0T4C5_9GAMM|nr:acetoacetate--CoA ligase [Marinihelvus fidelis]
MTLWHPHPDDIPNTRLAQFQAELGRRRGKGYDSYAELHADTVADPVTFWRLVWESFDVIGEEGHDALINADQMPGAQWFPQARLNFAENLLRYTDDRPAIKFRAETGQERTLTYAELYNEVARVAHALRQHGIQPGDRVAGFLPNLPETIIAMLAATSLGATWSSCSPDFGTAGVVDRLGQVEPRILFCVDSYAYGGKTHDCLARVEEIIKAIPSIEKVVVAPYLQPEPGTGRIDKAVTWQAFTDNDATTIEYRRLPFDHPLYILYSSGTTGVPKCITHGAGGTLLQHLKELGLHTDLTRDDRLFYFTTCGWMMWNWMASGLALGCTLVLFEGSPFHPGPEALWDLADDFDVTVFGTGAKAISAWEKAGTTPRETHKLTNLKAILSTGSVLAPEGFDYVYRDIKEDVRLSSISGGTDIVSCFALGCPTLPVHRGELQCLGLGMDVKIRDENGKILGNNEIGELCCDTPFPSMPVKFWNDPDNSKYKAAYFETFPGTWAHGDFAKITPHQGMIIYGRSDATLNPGGVRIGTAEIYRQVEKLPEVLESICVGQDWEDDVRVVLFVRLRDNLVLDDELRDRIRKTIRANTTPRHVPAVIVQVADIPRTVSGKITELAVRDVIHGREVKNLEALANPEALERFSGLIELET